MEISAVDTSGSSEPWIETGMLRVPLGQSEYAGNVDSFVLTHVNRFLERLDRGIVARNNPG